MLFVFFFQAEDGIRDVAVTGVQTCALPISGAPGLHAEDAEPAQPRGIRPAGVGPGLARAGKAVLLRFAVAAGVRPQPEEPGRESPRRLRAGARARGRLFHGSRDLAAERASVPVRRAAVGPGPH